MKNSSKMLFMTMTFISTIMVISSNNWMNMWMGMEINLMSFIPLMSKPKNQIMSQSMMMYFLTQSMASMLFITFMLINKYMYFFKEEKMIMLMIMMSMMMKMGMAPFHTWMPKVMNKMSWTMCLLLMTWQKIAPMYILSMIIEKNNIIMITLCLTAIIGAMGGINQTSTHNIMAYSSINHLSWLVASMMMYKKSWMLYMMVYTMMMMMMCNFFMNYNIMYINQTNIFMKSKTEKMNIIFLMLSLGGLPPFLGFMPKWIAIQYMINSKEMLIMMIMIVSTLITLSFYMRMSLSMNLIMNQSQKWMIKYSVNKKISTQMMILNTLLPMTILMMNFY